MGCGNSKGTQAYGLTKNIQIRAEQETMSTYVLGDHSEAQADMSGVAEVVYLMDSVSCGLDKGQRLKTNLTSKGS